MTSRNESTSEISVAVWMESASDKYPVFCFKHEGVRYVVCGFERTGKHYTFLVNRAHTATSDHGQALIASKSAITGWCVANTHGKVIEKEDIGSQLFSLTCDLSIKL